MSSDRLQHCPDDIWKGHRTLHMSCALSVNWFIACSPRCDSGCGHLMYRHYMTSLISEHRYEQIVCNKDFHKVRKAVTATDTLSDAHLRWCLNFLEVWHRQTKEAYLNLTLLLLLTLDLWFMLLSSNSALPWLPCLLIGLGGQSHSWRSGSLPKGYTTVWTFIVVKKYFLVVG